MFDDWYEFVEVYVGVVVFFGECQIVLVGVGYFLLEFGVEVDVFVD